MNHPFAVAFLVVGLACCGGALTPFVTRRHYLRNTAVALAGLAALMGLGALFGKVLGDFLRQVN